VETVLEVICSCAWRKGAEEVFDFGSYAILYLTTVSCSSGEKTSVSSAPVESRSSSSAEMSMRILMSRWPHLDLHTDC